VVFKITEHPSTRFWRLVKRSDGCWLWIGTKAPNGYGSFSLHGGKVLAHRFSYMQAFGAISENMQVCHRCDIRDCVRPDHLFLGTQSDNMRDASAKKRMANQKRDTCARGHAYTVANLYMYGSSRMCRRCHADREHRYRAERVS